MSWHSLMRRSGKDVFDRYTQFTSMDSKYDVWREREEKRDLAALPEEVKQIITDALTLMAARTLIK